MTVGTGTISPVGGGVLRHLGFDPNQHVVCNCGCGCGDDNNQAGQNTPSLSYASSTVNVLPVFMVSLASDFTAAVPSQIQAQLTFNGTAQGWVTFGTSGHNPGDVYALPLQVGSAVASSGHYAWGVEVKATVGTFVYDRTASGVLPVVVKASSPYGAGWSLGGTQSLLIGSAGVALIDNRTGGYRYFTGTGPGYTSPANDQGTLVKNMGGSFTYTSKEQLQTNFDSSGNMTSQVDPHGLTQSLSYSGGLLSTLTQPDGGVATFSYSGGLLSSLQMPGGRYLTLSYDGSNNLIGLVDAAGSVYTLGYDTSNRLVNEQVGPLNTTYTYSTGNGTLTQIDRGAGTTLSVTAAAVQGLGASTAINTSAAAAALTDALGNTTSYTLDALGRTTQLQTADGAVQSWALNSAGNPTAYVDQLGRTTSYAYNATQDMTSVAYPDGTFTTYQYELTFHQVTQVQDALGHLTTFAYNGTTSDLLTQKDALGNVTTFTWSNGLKQTMTDALGRVTTMQWNSTTRRQTAGIDALGNITSFSYDGAGNQIAVQDALGRYTSTSYDGERRPLTRTNALGGVASYTYDASGNQLSSVDELARTTSYVYDQRGLPVSMTEAVGTAQAADHEYDLRCRRQYVVRD